VAKGGKERVKLARSLLHAERLHEYDDTTYKFAPGVKKLARKTVGRAAQRRRQSRAEKDFLKEVAKVKGRSLKGRKV